MTRVLAVSINTRNFTASYRSARRVSSSDAKSKFFKLALPFLNKAETYLAPDAESKHLERPSGLSLSFHPDRESGQLGSFYSVTMRQGHSILLS